MQATAATAKRKAVVFPQKKSKARQIGHPKPMWTVRPPQNVEEWVNDRVRRGYVKNQVLGELMELGIDMIDGLGADYYEVERRAKVEGVSVGTIVARLVKEALSPSEKKRK